MTKVKQPVVVVAMFLLCFGVVGIADATDCSCNQVIGGRDYLITYKSSGACNDPRSIDYPSGLATFWNAEEGRFDEMPADPGVCL